MEFLSLCPEKLHCPVPLETLISTRGQIMPIILPLALPDFQTFLRSCTELQHRMSGFHIHSFTQLEPTIATQLEFYEVPLGTLS